MYIYKKNECGLVVKFIEDKLKSIKILNTVYKFKSWPKSALGLSQARTMGDNQSEKKSKHLKILSISLAVSLVYESNKDFNYTLHKMT